MIDLNGYMICSHSFIGSKSARDELNQTRQKLEDTGIRIGLLIEQLTKDTNIEPIEEEPVSSVASPATFG